MTQEEVAERAGVTRRQYNRYEMGKSVPNADNLIAIARALGCTIDYLFGMADSPNGRLREEDLTPLELALVNAVRERNLQRVLYLLATDENFQPDTEKEKL